MSLVGCADHSTSANLLATKQGYSIHSYYAGTPWVGFLLPFVKKYETAIVVEIAVCILGSMWLREYDKALANFLFFGAFSIAFKSGIEREIVKKRLQRMRDAELEQQHMLDRYRRGDF